MTAREIIEAMDAKGYWKSLEGRTPDRTVYSATAKEVLKKGTPRCSRSLRTGSSRSRPRAEAMTTASRPILFSLVELLYYSSN
jgi:hypothetical protein